MRIAVTGRHGQVVTSLIERGTVAGHAVIAIGRPELDLADPASVLRALEAARPDAIVSAAAYTTVDKAESEPELAHAVNGRGAGLVAQFVLDNLVNFLVINLSLACFNLLPLPPFDGSHIVEGLLPERAANAYARLRPLGFPIILVLLVVLPWLMPAIDPVRALLVPPVSWLGEHYLALASLVAGRPLDA